MLKRWYHGHYLWLDALLVACVVAAWYALLITSCARGQTPTPTATATATQTPTPTCGQPSGYHVTSVKEKSAGTSETLIATRNVVNAHMMQVGVYARITTSTSLTVTVNYVDATGAQTKTLLDDTYDAGSYRLPMLSVASIACRAVSVYATSGTADAARISASLKDM